MEIVEVSERDLYTKIKNPDTGNDISLRSALSYGKTHPVYQSALAKVKQNKNKPKGQNIF